MNGPSDTERFRKRLDGLFVQVSRLAPGDELRAHWTRYLYVLVSGYLEVCVKDVFNKYVMERSHPLIAAFVSQELRGLNNAKFNKILVIAEKFSPEKCVNIRNSVDEQTVDAVNSIVDLRNKIAHGGDTGVSLVNLKTQYSRLPILLDALRKEFPASKSR